MKILIAEDDKFLLNAYRVKFSKAGFEIKIVSDGEEALEALKTFVPDAMLLDLVMPKKDGFAVLEAVKADANLKKIPVIVASNLGQKEDIERAQKLGANDYIIKSDI
jgi:DNA-binding response OmpR family regulator